MIRTGIFISGLILLSSCGGNNKVPEAVLKPDKMQAVLWDVIKADAFVTGFIKKDTLKNADKENEKLQEQVFAIHHTTKDVFYKSYDYYKTNTTLFKEILDSIIAQENRRKNYGQKPLLAE
jgi:hypothetical protein